MLLQKIKSFAVILCAVTIIGAVTAGYSQDNSDQLSAWRRAATTGDIDAAIQLGDTYHNGWGVEKNDDEAFRWYLIAANGNNPIAEYAVGHAYWTGEGVKQDQLAAFDWYRKAATLGNAAAQNSMGDAYFYGQVVKQDQAMAASWYQKAANQGNSDAEYNLAEAYRNGTGVSKNDKQALVLYQKAVDKGNTLANRRMAEIAATPADPLAPLKNSSQLQVILVGSVLGSFFFIIKIRKQGEERYHLSFFISRQFGLLIFGAILFYITYMIAAACDPNGQDINFCESGSNVGIWIGLITAALALIINIKQSNPSFGAFYTLAQIITAYTFIPVIIIEVFRDGLKPFKKKNKQG